MSSPQVEGTAPAGEGAPAASREVRLRSLPEAMLVLLEAGLLEERVTRTAGRILLQLPSSLTQPTDLITSNCHSPKQSPKPSSAASVAATSGCQGKVQLETSTLSVVVPEVAIVGGGPHLSP